MADTHTIRTRMPRLGVLALSVQAALSGIAWALPQDGTVVRGQVSISGGAPGTMQINASNGAIINWKQFSIGAGETTQFVQPNSASAVLNRVVGGTASQLLGQLKANGQVFLINPNGIVVGAGARIDTNSFVGSTLDIADADFIAGKLRFFAGTSAGKIRNDGLITAGPGGRIALIAPDIENTGIIRAPDGNILLAAGRRLEIASMDLEGVTFEIQAPTDAVLNLGKLLADNGAVRAFAGTLRQSGEVRATRLTRDADGSIVLSGSNDVTLTSDSSTNVSGLAGGSILVHSAEGTARVSGELVARGSVGAGGDIRVLGQRVAVEAGAHLDASGSAGGGQILIGGDLQGSNPLVQNADRVSVAAGASLRADATESGDGGRIIVWANENTRFAGDLSVQGAGAGGDGGFAEVSGKHALEFTGTARLSAPFGSSGTLLLDPLDIIVSLTSGILPTVVDEFADFSSNVVTVSPVALAAVAGNVTLQATRDIYVRDAISLTTSGAGLTATAGGATFDAGSIFNNAGISTVGGGVTLRGQSISGSGGISTAGGAVDLMTAGTLSYSGAINSAGGAVTLASQTGSVNNAQVQAGSGTVQVTGQSGVFSGSFATTGTAGFTAVAGSLSVNDISAGTVNLNATGSINATVHATDRVNAASSGSYAQIYGDGSGPLRLGTVSGNSGLYFYSSTGLEMASGGLLTSSYLYFSTQNSSVSTGTAAAPIKIASPSALVEPRVTVQDMAAPAYLSFAGSPTLSALSLSGTVAAVGGSTVTGAANLGTLSLGVSGSVLNVAASSTGGLGNGFSLEVSDGGIHATTVSLPGAPVEFTAAGPVTVDTMGGGSLTINAQGAVAIGTATTTQGTGIRVYTNVCYLYNYAGCASMSPITAGTLDAGTAGPVRLETRDNGDITVTGSLTGTSANLSAGSNYYTSTYPYYYSQSTTNNINVAAATTTGSFTARNNGIGDIAIDSLAAGGTVDVRAGNTYRLSSPSYPYYNDVTTTNNIAIANVEPVSASGSFQVTNSGIGDLSVTGAITRPTGSVNLSAYNGSVTATGNISAQSSISINSGTSSVTTADLTTSYYDINVSAGTTLTVGQVSAGSASTYGNVSLNAGGDLVFGSVAAAAQPVYSSSYGYGSVQLGSDTGSIRVLADTTTLDVTATGNVSIYATDTLNGAIGNPAFTNPMDIRAGAASSVTLQAGRNIGAVGKPVNVDTSGSLDVSSSNGEFHVAATTGTAPTSLTTIRLAASAAGVGSGNSATFTSADLNVQASSDGATLTLGDMARSTGTLDEFRFAATGGSGLAIGDINFATTGYNQVNLVASGAMTQASGNISAGNVDLAAGSSPVSIGNVTVAAGLQNRVHIVGGDITTGNLTGPSVNVSGANLSLGDVVSTGTNRGFAYSPYTYVPRLGTYLYPLDDMVLSASGSLGSGNIQSATSVSLSAGNGVTVGVGTGTVNGGHFTNTYYYTDTVNIASGNGSLSAGNIAAYNVSLSGANGVGETLGAGTVTADGNLSVGGSGTQAVATGALSGGSGLTLNAGSFATGNLSTGGGLYITANGTGSQTYAPSSAIALSAGGNVSITAGSGIDLVASGTTLTAPTVSLLASGGNIRAALTGTSNLTLNSGAGFDVSSNTWLNNLNVTAQWDLATAPGSVGGSVTSSTASGSQSFSYGFDGALLLNVSSTLDAGRTWNLSYHDISANPVIASPTPSASDHLEASITHGGGGTISVSFDGSTAFRNTTANLSGGASLALSTGGDLDLTSVATNGGYVSAYSGSGTLNLTSVHTGGGSLNAGTYGGSGQNVNVESVATLGGNVSLSSASGSIVRAGAQPLQIDSRQANGAAGGTTSLSAPNGSVGTALAPLLTSGAVSLNVSALDDIAVDVANTALTNLSVTTGASGAGAIAVTNALNYGSLTLARTGGGTAITVNGLSPGAAGAFALTATDGDIIVGSDISNVTSLSLNAGFGINSTNDLLIQASGGPRSVAAGTYDLRAGRDVVIAAGASAGDSVAVTQTAASGYTSVYAGRDILVSAAGDTASLGHSASGWTQTLDAGRDLRVTGSSLAVTGASAAVTSTGYQTLRTGGALVIQAGSSTGASASIEAALGQSSNGIGSIQVLAGGDNATASLAGGYQSMTSVYGAVSVLGGSGANASARMASTSSNQDLGNGTYGQVTDILVQGGSGIGASAGLRAAGSQSVYNIGNIRVLGGTATGADAEILAAAGNQSIGRTYTYYQSVPTQDIVVQAGSAGTARIQASGFQNVQAGGLISVLGGSGAGTTAGIVSTGGSQSIGNSSTYFYDATGNILVQGGTGAGAVAAIRATGSQSVSTGGTISILGGAGAGANAEMISTGGSQSIGSTTATYYNDPTDSILVQAGAGGLATIKAQGSQTIQTGGDLSVLGGTGAGMIASIESVTSSQNIGYTYLYSNDPSGSITVRGGAGNGAAAWVRAASGQTIDAGGTITVSGGGAGAFAEIATTNGFQSIGNTTYYNDQTDSVTLAGGTAAGAYARISTGGSQEVRSTGSMSLSGGQGDGSGASLVAATGQQVLGQAALAITGGSGSTAGGNETGLYNTVSGGQTVSMAGNIAIVGGSSGSSTGIFNLGTSFQSIGTSGGSLSVVAPSSAPNNDGIVAIEMAAGPQTINVPNGSITVDNAGAVSAHIATDGNQTINARSMTIALSSPVVAPGGPLAAVSAVGNQTVELFGDSATPGTATLSIVNLSGRAGSSAAMSAGGDLTLTMDYDAAGAIKVGDVAAQGPSSISAGGAMTIIAGSMLLQGGATAASSAALVSAQSNPLVGDMVISTLYGPVELLGGSAGGAFIDPPLLSVTSNGSVLLQAGASASSNVNINAGQFNLAATTGDLSLVNSTTSAATASITANTFNYFGPGNVALIGGTITAVNASTITIGGQCFNCTTNLIGPWSVTAYVPPPVPPTDFSALVNADVMALADLMTGPFDITVDENGALVPTRRRLNQCY